MKTDPYEADFYAWTQEQAALLRSGRLAEADIAHIAHIAEEIEALGRAEKRELVSRPDRASPASAHMAV